MAERIGLSQKNCTVRNQDFFLHDELQCIFGSRIPFKPQSPAARFSIEESFQPFPERQRILNATNIIELQGVHKHYGNHYALRDVSLSIRPGITGLLGPNGSGKSTLIKSILGLVRIDAGQGRVLNFEWPKQTRVLRDRIGYLPEDDCYILGLQGIESIQMMARLSGLEKTEALRRAHEMADFCDIGQERYRNVETYSTGMRQKLKFAQALVHDPPFIILDEPTTGLDPAQREQFLDRMATIAKDHGKSILLSTHILHDVQRVCDDVVILVSGMVRLMDSLDNLQRPTETGLQVSVVNDSQRLIDTLSRYGIRSQVIAANDIKVFGDGEHVLQAIWRASAECGSLVQRIDQFRNSLEQTFLDAVRSH